MPPNRRYSLALAVSLCVAGPNGLTADFSYTPGADVRAVIDSNRRLTVLPHDTVAGTISSAFVDFDYQSATTRITLQPKYRLRRFSGNQGLNSNDYFVDLEGVHLFSLRHQLQVSAAYEKESNGTLEPAEAGLNFTNVDRITRSLSPSFTYLHNEQTSATISYSVSDTQFDQDQNSGFSDYSFSLASLQVSHAFSDKDSITGIVFRSSFELTGVQSETVSHALQIIYTRQLSPTLSATAGYGSIHSHAEFQTPMQTLIPVAPFFTTVLIDDTVERTGQLIDLGLTKEFERGQISAEFNRSVSPSSRGAQNVRDQWTLSGRYRLTQLLSADAQLRMYQNESQTGFARDSLDREFRAIRATLSYRIDKQWSISGGYAYRELSYDNNTGNGNNPDSHSFFVNLKFAGAPRTYSR